MPKRLSHLYVHSMYTYSDKSAGVRLRGIPDTYKYVAGGGPKPGCRPPPVLGRQIHPGDAFPKRESSARHWPPFCGGLT